MFSSSVNQPIATRRSVAEALALRLVALDFFPYFLRGLIVSYSSSRILLLSRSDRAPWRGVCRHRRGPSQDILQLREVLTALFLILRFFTCVRMEPIEGFHYQKRLLKNFIYTCSVDRCRENFKYVNRMEAHVCIHFVPLEVKNASNTSFHLTGKLNDSWALRKDIARKMVEDTVKITHAIPPPPLDP